MTAIRSYLDPYYMRLKAYRIPWEVSTAATAWVSYAYIMAIVVILASTMGCAAVQQADLYVAQPGFVEPVRWTAVYAGLRDALMGNERSLIMFNAKNSMVMFAWQRAGGWSWIVLDSTFKSAHNAIHAAGGVGNLMSCADFSCLTAGAEKVGYRQVTPTDLVKLAPAFCQSVLQQTVAFAQGALTSVFVMPAGVVPSDPWVSSVQ